jgi:large repetitive protein
VTINSTPAGVSGTLTVNAINGVATFSNLVFNTAGTYTLTAASAGLTSATSNSFTISAGSGNKLAITVQPPANGTAGQALTPAVVVQIQDSIGNVVAGSTAAVTIGSTPTGVGGTLPVNAINGVATFSNLVFNTTGNYTLTATSVGLSNATSTSVAIAAGTASKLRFLEQPANGTAGQTLTPAVAVQIQDSIGNVVTGSTAAVTLSSTPTGVGGTLTVNAINGVATFSTLSFITPGPYTLTAASAGLTGATSNSFTISAGSGNKLVITAQPPANGTAGQALTPTPALVVQIQDSIGNVVTGSTAAVTINSTPAGVSGTLTVNAINGVATFSNLVFSTAGTYTLTAASPGLANATSASITIVPPLAITTTSLNPATLLAPFSQQLTATGGTLPYTWSIPAGALSAGVNLSTSGLIGGTPTVAGSFGFTARVRDNAGATADKALTLVVASALTFSACPASNGIVGQSYSSAAVAAGGTQPYTWVFLAGSLPPGLTLVGATGAVTGIPTSSGVFSVTLQATDKSGAAVSQACGLTIAPGLSITTPTLSDASVSSAYTQTLLATGGKGPYTWTLAAGTLPAGLTLASSGVLSGTPTQTGFFTFTIAVTDSTQTSVQQGYTMSVVTGLIVGACPAGIGELGIAYTSALVAQGGTSPYTWSVTGTLPPGLQLNAASGVVSGTPTQVVVAQLNFTTTDRANRTASKQCAIDVRAALAITTAALSQGNTGASYSDSIAVSGGVSPFVFSTTAGSLPTGISLDAGSGKFSGRPISAGSFTFTAAVTDNLGAQATKSLSITVAAGLTIPNCPTPAANVGQAYSAVLVAQGGASPYVWSIGSGPLPPGLALDSPNAVIAGVPTTPGTSPYVLRVDDNAGNNVTRACSIQVNPAALAITSAASLPNALIGVAYSQTLAATGGVGPYSWSVASGALPPSFSLDPGGVLSGTASTAGTFNFTVQAADRSGTVARQNITLVVLAGTAPGVTISGLPDIVDPATQPAFGVQLDSSYPAPIDGTLILTVVPDSAVGVVDPAVQFANGGQTLKFTVAANSNTPDFAGKVAALQTGTVAGTIQLSVRLVSSGLDVTATRNVRIDRLAPRIVTMSVLRTASGLEVHIVGFSTTREVTQGSFQFSVSGGAPLSAAVPMSDGGKAWFSSQQSLTFGGQFSLVQPFTLQGSVGTLTSVSVTLSNAQGTSSAVSANF